MSSSKKQLCVFVTFHIKPDQMDQWKAVHRQIWEPAASEPGCLLFDIFESLEERGLIKIVEVWDADREWFQNVQMKKPYYALLEKSRPYWAKPARMEYFERFGEGSVFTDGYLAGATKKV